MNAYNFSALLRNKRFALANCSKKNFEEEPFIIKALIFYNIPVNLSKILGLEGE